MKAITINDLSKKFKIYHDKASTMKERLLFRKRNAYEEFWALKDINLDFKKGETIGLIGQNGSGKSTLLKLLARILFPTSGNVEINGVVSSLIELGAGFHQDMTGTENIYTNAAIFGMSKKEIDKKIKGIIDFSELEEFIDNPVRTYSSGMYMRLAFSVAINVDPDILLIDEILAVGDANFQRKCFERLYELKKHNVTIVFVSHDLGSVQRLCDRVIWLNNGVILEDGNSIYVVNRYLKYMSDRYDNNVEVPAEQPEPAERTGTASGETPEFKTDNRWGNRKVEISNINLSDSKGRSVSKINTNQPLVISFNYDIKEPVDSIVFGISIKRTDGLHCYGTNTFLDGNPLKELSFVKKKGSVRFVVDSFSLLENSYIIDVAASSKLYDNYDYHFEAKKLIVNNSSNEIGAVSLKHNWIVEE